jgi:hypothetical protein
VTFRSPARSVCQARQAQPALRGATTASGPPDRPHLPPYSPAPGASTAIVCGAVRPKCTSQRTYDTSGPKAAPAAARSPQRPAQRTDPRSTWLSIEVWSPWTPSGVTPTACSPNSATQRGAAGPLPRRALSQHPLNDRRWATGPQGRPAVWHLPAVADGRRAPRRARAEPASLPGPPGTASTPPGQTGGASSRVRRGDVAETSRALVALPPDSLCSGYAMNPASKDPLCQLELEVSRA